MKKTVTYFSKFEWTLLISSIVVIAISFAFAPEKSILSFISSLIGVGALLFCAKGNPFGQILMIVFCIMYGIISYQNMYYGEVMTYVFMTGPMAIYALISWLKNPYNGNRSEVKVNKITLKEMAIIFVLSLIVTAIFYFILKAFDTANLFVSTISITTSFLAVYLTARRSPYYALAYAANDIVLIILWAVASIKDTSCLSTLTCFAVFFAHDIYGFISWRRMEIRQQENI